MNNFEGKSVILFDGVCNLCNSSINFIIKNDKKKHFLFASLQSDAAKEILLQHNSKKNNLNSIILIENETLFEKSTAILKITKHFSNGYQFLSIFSIIPTFIRDTIYMLISKNRYKWFGKKDSCIIPSEELKGRFL
jgi:predicted DCC family thiol-disulfide oxidoreductase YuxK